MFLTRISGYSFTHMYPSPDTPSPLFGHPPSPRRLLPQFTIFFLLCDCTALGRGSYGLFAVAAVSAGHSEFVSTLLLERLVESRSDRVTIATPWDTRALFFILFFSTKVYRANVGPSSPYCGPRSSLYPLLLPLEN